ncbi:MAG: DUF192 domain-containing protein [Patescibacteria group bacterium]
MGDQTFKTISYATAVIGLAIIVLYLFFGRSRPLAVKNIKIGNAGISVEIAESFRAQERGLSGRQSLGQSGMLFVYKDKAIRYFWMPDMNFALDALWIANGTVVGWQENIPFKAADGSIPRFQSNVPVDMVLEVNAGWIGKHGIKVGDRVEY